MPGWLPEVSTRVQVLSPGSGNQVREAGDGGDLAGLHPAEAALDTTSLHHTLLTTQTHSGHNP